MYQRTIEKKMDEYFSSHYSFTIYGARRTGKTTLILDYAKKSGLEYKYLDCDLYTDQELLNVRDVEKLKNLIGGAKLLLIDEAQRVQNIGLNMKIIHDHIPEVKVIATGSSALDLSSRIKESMTGRDFDFYLFPFSLQELAQKKNSIELSYSINDLLIYGTYPNVIELTSYDHKKEFLQTLTTNYLYKDLLELDLIKKTSLLSDLLRALATCIGSEINSSSLANKLNTTKETVERYIDLLEQCFIIKRIRPYNRKVLNEVKYPYKVYFWDLGVRNALLGDFKSLSLRSDLELGGLWENFIFVERMKKARNAREFKNFYFWRTNEGRAKEYDLIEEMDGVLNVFEIKWGQAGVNKVKKYPVFFETYPGSELHVISKDNFVDFLV